MTERKSAFTNLFETATEQQGFFTTKQAEASGFARQTHYYHVKTGDWIREYRGIYRLAHYPSPERPDLIRWWLWSRNRQEIPQGVFSHETSLAVHQLSDVMPAKLHMTVPKGFRRMAPIPRGLVLHIGNLPATDIERLDGVPVIKALRTILDLLRESRVPQDVLVQALREGLQRGIITQKAIRDISLPEELGREFREIVARAA